MTTNNDREMMAYQIAERDAMGSPTDEQVNAALEALPENAVYVNVPADMISAYRQMQAEAFSSSRGVLYTDPDGFITVSEGAAIETLGAIEGTK